MQLFGRTRRRLVTGTVRDPNDDVVALTGAWGSASRSQVISDLESAHREYVVEGPDGTLVSVEIRRFSTDAFIWVSWTGTHNNIDDLSRTEIDNPRG
jgi:hypothetical protein